MISKLKEARETSGYTIEDIADKLNIRKQYLLALEEENYDALPGKIYVEGYTKIYYEFLGINNPLQDQNNILSKTKMANNGDNEGDSKYKKYIIFCSVILLVLVVMFYNFLKFQNQESDIIESDIRNDGTDQETFDGSYKTD